MVECLLSLYQMWIRFIHTVIDWVFGCVQVLVDDRPARWSGEEWSGTVLNRGEFTPSDFWLPTVRLMSVSLPYHFILTSSTSCSLLDLLSGRHLFSLSLFLVRFSFTFGSFKILSRCSN